MELNFRTLKANEIDVRVGNVDKNNKWITLLLYKNARVDMDLLDETVGRMNWERMHLRDNANCVVSIYDTDKDVWVSKEDTGSESNTEKEKGQASDSFKRACVNWGIGRELYTAPKIFIYGNAEELKRDLFRVADISYNDNREINKLVIVNKKGEIIYAFPKNNKANTAPSEKMITSAQVKKLQIILKEKPDGYKEALYKKLKIKSSKELTFAKATSLIKKLETKTEETNENN